jgi:hypothetical protein
MWTLRSTHRWIALGHVILFLFLLLLSIESFPVHSTFSRRTTSTVRIRLAGTTTTRDSSFTQVVSDVDDTLKSSGGVNVAGVALGGIDVQYERGDFYPGVAEFMLEISRYGVDHKLSAAPPKIAILTARAEEFKVALEIKENSKLAVAMRTAGERAGVSDWGVGPVLYGSVAEWVVQFRKGLRKFTNFERLLQQDPTGMIMQVRAWTFWQFPFFQKGLSHTPRRAESLSSSTPLYSTFTWETRES